MTITLQRILIDEGGSARVFYARDDGPGGSLISELKGTPELDALLALLRAAVQAQVTQVDEQRAAARAAIQNGGR